jgi:hypothetical protein
MAQQGIDIEEVRSEIAEKAEQIVGQAVEFAREKPHLAVGAAFGIGWILGNGLPPRVLMMAARLGWKAMLGGALASSGLMGILGGEDTVSPKREPRVSMGSSGAQPRGM